MLAVVATLAIGGTSTASAATVSVVDEPAFTNHGRLEFQAAPGESNEVTISIAGRSQSFYEIKVLDSEAPVDPGPRCSGGGAVGVAAFCLLQIPRGPQYEYCGHDCSKAISGTAWDAKMFISLGDKDNSLDASALPTENTGEAIGLVVTSGAGDDLITTASGQDRIDPGAGSDQVHAGGGREDYVEATATPDGADLYDLGDGESDQVSYRRRSDPVYLAGDSAGAAGENDHLVGVEMVAGGSGADVLTGGPAYRLLGNDGNDRITGTSGKDLIAGGTGDDVLFGGGDVDNITGDLGNDILDGGDGNDTLADHFDWFGNPGEASGGADVAYGQGGNDRIELEGDDDRAEGGAGNDLLYGGEGDDSLSGGEGEDAVVGEAGADQLLGGPGPDRLYASRAPQPLFTNALQPLDPASDRVDCGPGGDHALVNPWDRVNRCETMRSSPRFRLPHERFRLRGATGLSVVISASGRLSLSGPDVRAVKRTVSVRTPHNRQGRRAVRLLVRPKGSALATLRRNGRIRVWVTVRFHSNGGVSQVRKTRVTITRRG
jgi:hemolysin type calcium-binding protein